MALASKIVDFVGLRFLHDAGKTGRVGQIAEVRVNAIFDPRLSRSARPARSWSRRSALRCETRRRMPCTS